MDANTSSVLNATPAANLTISGQADPVSYVEAGLIAAVVGIFAIITVTGNLLTIIAFYRDEKLRSNMSNWYLVNLACADLLVGCIPLPMDGALYVYQGSVWLLGAIACKSLLTIDFIATAGSVYAVVLISLDRYWLVTEELSYKMFQTQRKVFLLCFPTWVVICVVTLFLTWAYPHLVHTQYVDYEWLCDAEFLYHRELAIVYSIITFFIPLLLMLYLNICVYVNVYRRSRRRGSARQTHVTQPRGDDSGGGFSENGKRQVRPFMRNLGSHGSQADNNANSHSDNGRVRSDVVAGSAKKQKDRRHIKTARTLAIIVGAYVVCWAPYNIVLMMITFSQDGYKVSETVWVVCLYLLRFNSTLNPFLYAMCNVRFRQHFKKMLCCFCPRKRIL